MTCFLLELPEELLVTVVELIHPASLVDAAVSCRDLYRIAGSSLAEHKNHHARLRICHNRQPATTPSLLEMALDRPPLAWHVRCLEIWGMRTGWELWKDVWRSSADHAKMEVQGRELPEEPLQPDPDAYRSHLESGELEPYGNIMRTHLHLAEEDVRDWLENIRNGLDDPLKVMLMALAPALHRVRFIADGYGYEQCPSGPLPLLGLAISRIAVTKALWPPGFDSLREVYVGAHPPGWLPDWVGGHTFITRPSAVAPLFLLSHLKKLHVTCAWNDNCPDICLPAKSSSIEELGFYVCDFEIEGIKKLVECPRRLKTLFADCVAPEELLQHVSEHQGQSIERLFSRIRLTSMEDRAILLRFPNLKVLGDLGYFAIADGRYDSDLPPRPLFMGLQYFLPPSLTHLTLDMSSWDMHGKTEQEELIESSLFQCVAELAADVRFNELKTICMWRIVRTGQNGLADRVCSRDHEQIRLIEALGIHTHLHSDAGMDLKWKEHGPIHQTIWDECVETDIEYWVDEQL